MKQEYKPSNKCSELIIEHKFREDDFCNPVTVRQAMTQLDQHKYDEAYYAGQKDGASSVLESKDKEIESLKKENEELKAGYSKFQKELEDN